MYTSISHCQSLSFVCLWYGLPHPPIVEGRGWSVASHPSSVQVHDIMYSIVSIQYCSNIAWCAKDVVVGFCPVWTARPSTSPKWGTRLNSLNCSLSTGAHVEVTGHDVIHCIYLQYNFFNHPALVVVAQYPPPLYIPRGISRTVNFTSGVCTTNE